MSKVLFLLCALAWTALSCNKEGIGGKADISGVVKHDQTIIPSAIVYIKYGANSFPGFDLEQYDAQTSADGSDASYSFTNLYKGDYYLYATGVNTIVSENVSGGTPVNIITKKESIVMDIVVKQ